MVKTINKLSQAYLLLVPKQIAIRDGSGVATMLSHFTSTHALNKNSSQTYACFFQPWDFYLYLGLEQLKDRTIKSSTIVSCSVVPPLFWSFYKILKIKLRVL